MRTSSALEPARLMAAVVLGGVIAAAAVGLSGSRAAVADEPEMTGAADGHEVAILAGGCFWGMEDLLCELDGVVDTEVGYAGGHSDDATYRKVSKGTTGHAESVRVVFDPSRLSYEDLLRFYFRIHDPTTKNRQGNDVGSQYRSAILVLNDEQRRTAERVRAEVDASGFWKRPLVTEIADAGTFVRAEDYHQDYLEKNPGGYTCHFVRPEPQGK